MGQPIWTECEETENRLQALLESGYKTWMVSGHGFEVWAKFKQSPRSKIERHLEFRANGVLKGCSYSCMEDEVESD